MMRAEELQPSRFGDRAHGPLASVLQKMAWMRKEAIWPNGLRYLWTDSFGIVLLVSLYRELRDERFLLEAEWLVGEVDRVLGRKPGYRIGEASDRDGQYFHYTAMLLFALGRLGEVRPEPYLRRARELAKAIHPHFVRSGGVVWKMLEDLSGPYPGYGFGGLDHYHGFVVLRLLDPGGDVLRDEIAQLRDLVQEDYPSFSCTQDLGLGMALWFSHFFPDEEWARTLRARALSMLESMWVDPPGYFSRHPGRRDTKFAFTNYGVSIGLQAVGAQPQRVDRLNEFFASYKSGDEYDREAITHVMACCSLFPGLLLHSCSSAGE